MRLTGPVLRTLLEMFPDGCDVVEGRADGHVHAEPLEVRPHDRSIASAGVLVGGELTRDPTQAGCIGILRDTYFKLPEAAEPEGEHD